MILLLCLRGLAAEPIATWDLEQDDGGFNEAGELGQWSWGAVTGGPGSGYDGENAWAIGLGGSYLNDATEYLQLPDADLSTAGQPVLRFQHWYMLGAGDVGYVEVDEGAGWRTASPIYGYPSLNGWTGASSGWQEVSVPLPDASLVRIRFAFVADLAGTGVGWYIDQPGLYDGDVTAPHVVSLTALADTEVLDAPYGVSAWVEDDTGVDAVTLLWSNNRGDSGSAALASAGNGEWRGSIPSQVPDTVVSYSVLATDGANSVNWPSVGGQSFRVYLAAPTGLSGPEGRVVGHTARLSWSAPASIHEVVGYEVVRDGEWVSETTLTEVDVPISGGSDTFTVAAVYAAGVGDPSDPVEVNGTVPSLKSVTPSVAYAGDALRVRLEAQSALFADGEVTVELGEGVVVTEVEVIDVNALYATLEVDVDAPSGLRELVVTSAGGTTRLPEAFEVLTADDRPRLLSIEPSFARQGDTDRLEIQFVGELAAAPTLSLGEDVVVTGVEQEGDTLRVDYAVGPDAPLGDHLVIVDDGVRALDGVSLEIKNYLPPVGSCASAGSAPMGALGLAAAAGLLAARRRSR